MKKVITAFLLAGMAAPVLADGFYVAGDLGRDRWTSNMNDSTMTANVFSIAGGYEFALPFQDSMALEIGYRDLGGINESDGTVQLKTDVAANQFSVIARHTFTDQLSLYGRLGYAELTIDSKLHNAQSDISGSTSKGKVFGGIGGRYAFDEHLGVHIEYDRYDKIGEVVISALLVGAEYHF